MRSRKTNPPPDTFHAENLPLPANNRYIDCKLINQNCFAGKVLKIRLKLFRYTFPQPFRLDRGANYRPFALKRTGKLSHSLRHKKSRGFKRDFFCGGFNG